MFFVKTCFFVFNLWLLQEHMPSINNITARVTETELIFFKIPQSHCRALLAHLYLVCSSILGRQTSESKFADPPAFLRHFSEACPLLSSSFGNLRADREQWWSSQQNGCASEEIYFCIWTTFVILNALTLDYIATLFRSIYTLHGLAVRAIKCQVVLFSGCSQ